MAKSNLKSNLIKDLLPLYAEDLLSDESKKFVEENISTYPEYEKQLKDMKKEIQIKDKYQGPLKFLFKSINREKKSYGFAIAIFVLSILIVIFSFLTKPTYFTDDGNLYHVTEVDDQIFIIFNEKVSQAFVDDSGEIKLITAYSRPIDKIISYNKVVLVFNSNESLAYTGYDNEPVANIKNFDNENSGMLVLPRLLLNGLNSLALIFFVIGLIALILLKLDKSYYIYILGLPLSYLAGLISIKGFSLSYETYSLSRELIFICLLSLAYYMLIIAIYNIKKNKL